NVTEISQIDISFSINKKNLVSSITDRIYDKKSWDLISDIDLSGKELVSLNDLMNLLPNLRTLNISNNMIRFLDGCPKKIDSIIGVNNKFDGTCSFSKYRDLEYLNLMRNSLENLMSFKQLIHLKELNVRYNKINDLSGIGYIQNLIKVDLRNNRIKEGINFKKWRRLIHLEQIDLSNNRILEIKGTKYLKKLRILKADNNRIEKV
ncbi:outer arm dynein light chain 1, partial [Ascoidea rubescens DSM 1968]